MALEQLSVRTYHFYHYATLYFISELIVAICWISKIKTSTVFLNSVTLQIF